MRILILFIIIFVLSSIEGKAQSPIDSVTLYQSAYQHIVKDLNLKEKTTEVSDIVADMNCFFGIGKFDSKEMDKKLYRLNLSSYKEYQSETLHTTFKRNKNWNTIIFFSKIRENIFTAEVIPASHILYKAESYEKITSMNMMGSTYVYLFLVEENKIKKTVSCMMNY